MKKEWIEADFCELDICETASATDWMPYATAMSGMNTLPADTEAKNHKGNNGNHYGQIKNKH